MHGFFGTETVSFVAGGADHGLDLGGFGGRSRRHVDVAVDAAGRRGHGHGRQAGAAGRAEAFAQQPAHAPLADEDDEDEDAGQDVEDIGRHRVVRRAHDAPRHYLRHPRDSHQDEQAQDHHVTVEKRCIVFFKLFLPFYCERISNQQVAPLRRQKQRG